MADDPTLGELGRRMDRYERDQRATDDRITNVAKAAVPTDLWASEHKALQDDLRHLEADTREAIARVEKTSLERRAALTVRDDELAKAIEKARAEARADVAALKAAIEQGAASRGAWSRQLKITVFTIAGGLLAALLGAWVTALLTAKGLK